jgi:hypothetical protein
MPFHLEDEKKPDEVVAETPPEETPPAETPPEEPPKTVHLTAEELEAERNRYIAKGRRKAEWEAGLKTKGIETELASLKKEKEAGQRPLPPDPASFTDSVTGEIDRSKYQNAVVQHEDKLHAWRQAQGEPTPVASAPGPTLEDFKTRYEPMKQKYADYEEVINRPVFTREIMEALFESEQGPEIAYFLGKNEAEALRIADLSPAQMLKEIGKLEGKFSAESTKRTISGAPPPITPVGGTATVDQDPDKMTTPEWMAHENRQRLEKIKKAQTFGG